MPRNVRYIIFNGPPSSGKTTIAKELTRELAAFEGANAVVQDSFAMPLRHFFAVALGDKFQSMNKEIARPELNGYSLRDAWIDLAERYMKDRYGEDCFARWLVYRTLKNPLRMPIYVIIDDGGFEPEVSAVPNRFVVRVLRYGRNFVGDSRGYVEPYQYQFDNNESLIELFRKTRCLAEAIRGSALELANG